MSAAPVVVVWRTPPRERLDDERLEEEDEGRLEDEDRLDEDERVFFSATGASSEDFSAAALVVFFFVVVFLVTAFLVVFLVVDAFLVVVFFVVAFFAIVKGIRSLYRECSRALPDRFARDHRPRQGARSSRTRRAWQLGHGAPGRTPAGFTIRSAGELVCVSMMESRGLRRRAACEDPGVLSRLRPVRSEGFERRARLKEPASTVGSPVQEFGEEAPGLIPQVSGHLLF